MGRPIVKLAGQYLEWSTITDSPSSFGMTLEELVAHTRNELGEEGVRDLSQRIARVDAKGTSAINGRSAEDTIWLNRAGPGETPLHVDEIVEFYIRRKQAPSLLAVAAFRVGLARCGPSCVAIVRNGCASFCRKCWGTGFVREGTE